MEEDKFASGLFADKEFLSKQKILLSYPKESIDKILKELCPSLEFLVEQPYIVKVNFVAATLCNKEKSKKK
jgi:hypothetical protein